MHWIGIACLFWSNQIESHVHFHQSSVRCFILKRKMVSAWQISLKNKNKIRSSFKCNLGLSHCTILKIWKHHFFLPFYKVIKQNAGLDLNQANQCFWHGDQSARYVTKVFHLFGRFDSIFVVHVWITGIGRTCNKSCTSHNSVYIFPHTTLNFHEYPKIKNQAKQSAKCKQQKSLTQFRIQFSSSDYVKNNCFRDVFFFIKIKWNFIGLVKIVSFFLQNISLVVVIVFLKRMLGIVSQSTTCTVQLNRKKSWLIIHIQWVLKFSSIN